jgi:hypothetical protein
MPLVAPVTVGWQVSVLSGDAGGVVCTQNDLSGLRGDVNRGIECVGFGALEVFRDLRSDARRWSRHLVEGTIKRC